MLQAALDFFRSAIAPKRSLQNKQEPDFRNPIWNVEEDDDTDDELYHQRGNMEGDVFQFYDSFDELERFMSEFSMTFEQNMKHFNKSFFGFSNEFPNFAQLPDERNNLRDNYLLPGYQPRSSDERDNVDSDLDGKIDSKSLSKFFNDSPNNQIVEKPKTSFPPQFYGQTIITTTITKPDGTIEKKKIVRDHQGNEETTTTITQKGDGNNTFEDSNFPRHDDFANLWKQFFWK